MDEIKPKQTYNFAQVKKILFIGDNSMANLVREGKLHPKIVGKRYVYLGEDILNFLKSK